MDRTEFFHECHIPSSEWVREHLRVAVCGHLPTACDFLLRHGGVELHQYEDAAEIPEETAYHLILVYAPNAEGILDTVYTRGTANKRTTVPLRLLNEPACDSALLELRSMIRRIHNSLPVDQREEVADA